MQADVTGPYGPPRCAAPDDLRRYVGEEIYVSEWIELDQARIDLFAEATGDHQWIHVDVKKAAQSSAYGGTIAHGFLTLSLLGKFYEDFLPAWLPFCDVGVNYGLNRVRFTQPVLAGSRVRARFHLTQIDDVPGGVQASFSTTMELQGAEKPACVADSIVRRYFRTEVAV